MYRMMHYYVGVMTEPHKQMLLYGGNKIVTSAQAENIRDTLNEMYSIVGGNAKFSILGFTQPLESIIHNLIISDPFGEWEMAIINNAMLGYNGNDKFYHDLSNMIESFDFDQSNNNDDPEDYEDEDEDEDEEGGF